MRLKSLMSVVGLLLAFGCTEGGGGSDPAIGSVVVEAGAEVVGVGEGLQLRAFAVLDDGSRSEVTDDAVWSSSDDAIAAFDDNRAGWVTGLAVGEFEAVAVYDGVRSAPVRLTAEVLTGVDPVPALSAVRISIVGDGAVALERGQTLTLTATAVYEDGTESPADADVAWAVSDDAIATIDAGVLTALRRGTVDAVATLDGVAGRLAVEVVCPYPEGATGIGFGQVVPPLRWGNAYTPDGEQLDFGMQAFHCDPEYDDRQAMILVLGAGWCSACTQYTTQLLGPIAESLVEAGAQILYVEAQDYNYNPSGSDFAYRHLRQLIGEGPGIRAGDADTFNGDRAARAYIQDLPNVDAFPQVWVIRRSDMRVVADQNIGQYYLPLPDIIADVDADWSNPPPYRPPFVPACEPEDEEIYEPNDTVLESGFLQPGSFEGGLCTDPAVDFYSVGLQGAWRLTVEFSHQVGDIDVVLWDKREDQPLAGPDGEAIGSFSTSDQEVIEYFGPADVQVYGYNNASGRYTLTLEER